MTETMDQAPNFGTSGNYPGAGGKIGPAWQRMWEAMADRQWHSSSALAEVGANTGEIIPKTAATLLYSAAKFGAIEKQTRPHPTRRGSLLAWYRRTR